MLTDSNSNLNTLVAKWANEAQSLYGTDWKKISSHMRERFEALPAEAKVRLELELAITICDLPSSIRVSSN